MLVLLALLQTPTIPPLPDSSGWGVHVLALARAPDQSIWVGTYGQGIFVLRPGRGTGDGGRVWERIRSSSDTAAHAISWDFVHAFGFGPRGQVWYGTVGNGWGLSTDGGKTWKNWEFGQLGPEWQYVTPTGIVTRGDTTYIATADGIKVTWDDGQTWRVITDSIGATTARDSVWGTIGRQYVFAMALGGGDGGNTWISTPNGIGHSTDGGRNWQRVDPPPCDTPCVNRARSLVIDPKGRLWAAAEPGLYAFGRDISGWRKLDGPVGCHMDGCPSTWTRIAALALRGNTIVVARGKPVTELRFDILDRFVRRAVAPPRDTTMVFGTDPSQEEFLLLGREPSAAVRAGRARAVFSGSGIATPRHTWFRRPIALTDQPHIDQTYRFGSTMGGNFQPHQGVEFNNADGTPVHAIGRGVVVHAGPAERGALTVAIKHDRRLSVPPGHRPGVSPDGYYLFSVYYHNSRLLAAVGDSVNTGDVIALVGNTGRATNDHLHLEVHASPFDSTRLVVDPEVRYPPYNTNPELWIDPLPGTGIVAGQVWDSAGKPVQQARIYGLVKSEPRETPFSFIETYGPRNHSDPAYQEHFAISDVPPGDYVLGVEIGGARVFRRVQVEAGRLTWVIFRP